jgi:hypothetical protein
MSTTNSHDDEGDHFFVLARAYCRNGTVHGSREQRLTCALVELRERIKEQFLKVSKTWQVSAQEVRRWYSYAYPNSVPSAADPLCLEHACEEVMRDVRSTIQNYARQYAVPDDLLETMLTDWLVSDAMGTDRTPSAFFIPETEVASEDAEDKLPTTMELLKARPREAGATGEEPADGEKLLPG